MTLIILSVLLFIAGVFLCVVAYDNSRGNFYLGFLAIFVSIFVLIMVLPDYENKPENHLSINEILQRELDEEDEEMLYDITLELTTNEQVFENSHIIKIDIKNDYTITFETSDGARYIVLYDDIELITKSSE